MRGLLLRLLSCVLAVVIATAPVFADTAALVRTGGTVQVNGSVVPPSTSLLVGDTLRTGIDGVSTITREGTTVLLAHESAVVWEESGLELLCGTAVVTAGKGFAARVGNLTIAPTDRRARFGLRHSAEKLELAAERGDLEISDGERSMTLKQGNSMIARGGCQGGTLYQARAVAYDPGPASPSSAAPAAQNGTSTGMLIAAFLVPIVATVVAVVVATDNAPPEPLSQ